MGNYNLNIRESREKKEKVEIKKIDKEFEIKKSQKNHFEQIFNRI